MMHEGTDSLWRSVKAMPTEKLTWKPSETSRTAQELLAEIVMTTGYTAKLVKVQKDPGMGETEQAVQTVEELEKAHRANVELFLQAVKGLPEEKFLEKIELPWGSMTFLSAISYAYWNLMYHLGQINYIQTMYGDQETY